MAPISQPLYFVCAAPRSVDISQGRARKRSSLVTPWPWEMYRAVDPQSAATVRAFSGRQLLLDECDVTPDLLRR
jgi:hypothetical protein